MPRYSTTDSNSISTPPTHQALARLRTGLQASPRAGPPPPARPADPLGPPAASASTSTSTPPRRSGPNEATFETPRRPASSGAAGLGPGGTPRTRKGAVRIIKSSRKPWYQRLAAVPRDLWDRYELSVSETVNLDSDALADFAYPAAIATLTLHILLRASLGATDALTSRKNMSSSLSRSAKLADTAEARLEELRRSTQGTMHRWAGAGGRGTGFIYTVAHALCWIAVLVSIGNAMWLFTRRRQYRLFLRRDPINSPNAKTVRLGNAAMQRRMEGGSEPEGGAETDALWKRCLRGAWHLLVGNASSGGHNSEQQQIQELSVWTPPSFSLRFFAIYSPPLALLTQLMDRSNLLSFSLAAMFLLAQTYGLIHVYSQLVRDRHTISREVMHEYDAKFVNPRVNYARRDVSTSTAEDEAEEALLRERGMSSRDAYGADAWQNIGGATPVRHGTPGSTSIRKSIGRNGRVSLGGPGY